MVAQTEAWISSVVIGCNFCPFASRVIMQRTVRFTVSSEFTAAGVLNELLAELQWLNGHDATETTLLILPAGFSGFMAYLNLADEANRLLRKKGYEGVYQLASFHPDYRFAGSKLTDAANYTNRSPYPMLHILREASITKALAFFPEPDKIPERNIAIAREKGVEYMRMLLEACK